MILWTSTPGPTGPAAAAGARVAPRPGLLVVSRKWKLLWRWPKNKLAGHLLARIRGREKIVQISQLFFLAFHFDRSCALKCFFITVNTGLYSCRVVMTQAEAPYVVLETSVGKLVVELYWKHAPKTCQNFASLAARGYYDNVAFHRIVPGFMIQV